MPDNQLLLIQARQPGYPTEAHEKTCIERRLAGHRVQLRTHNALSSPADLAWLEGIDGLVIGGSGRYSVHHPQSLHWVEPLRRLLDAALKKELPYFGICFGHQLLGLHLGAAVETHEQYAEFGTIEVTTTDKGREDPLFGVHADRWAVHTGHTDAVMQIPDGVTLLARSNRLETQAFHVDGLPFYSTQFHPDLTASEALQRYREIIQPEIQDEIPLYWAGRDESNDLLGRFATLHLAPDRT